MKQRTRWKRDPLTGSFLKDPEVRDAEWGGKDIVRICWWDDDSPPIMRFTNEFNAPPVRQLFGMCIPRGILVYEDNTGWFREVGWYNKISGFTWLLLPGRRRADTVLRRQLLWDNWINLQHVENEPKEGRVRHWFLKPYRVIKYGERS